MALGVVAVAVAGRCARRRPRLAVVAGCVALVCASAAWRVADATASPLLDVADRARVVTAEVTVTEDARPLRPPGDGSGSGGSAAHDDVGDGAAVTGAVITRAWWPSGDGRTRVMTGRDAVTLFVDRRHADLVVGRTLTVLGALRRSDAGAGPATEQLVMDVTRRSESRPAAWWWESSAVVRGGVREASSHTGRAPSALVPALVTGDDSSLPPDVETEFRTTGLTHLLAVSGTNLTIVLALVLSLARAGRAPPRVLFVLGVLSVVAFVLVARPDPSVLRAAGMGLVALSSVGFGARGGLRLLSVAVIALVTLDPALARAPGFVLSVCATAGILTLAPSLATRLSSWLPYPAAVAVAVPLAAQAACTPAIAALSSEVSLVAVAANVVAAPAVAPATVCGLLGGLASLLWTPAGTAIGSLAGWSASWIVLVADRGARLQGASLAWMAPWWLLVLVVPVVLWAVWRAARHPALVLGLALGLTIAIWRPPQPGWPPPGWLMVACDVGQGDATVLRSGPGAAVVVDTGEQAADIDRCLRALHIDRVEALVITHADADHVGGWPGVLRGREVGALIVGRPGARVAGLSPRQVGAGDAFQAGAVDARVLWPPASASTHEPPADARNGLSVVLRAEIDGVVVLLSGDLGEEEQQRLLASGQEVAAHVLKVAHHGSADTSERFVKAVGAGLATVSAGADNDYGHPAPAALAMLRAVGTHTWRTDLHGDIAIVSDDGRLGVVTRR